MSFLILTKLQSDMVSGETSPGAILMPVALADGNYCLPVRVLLDPAHESKWGVLSGLPRRDTVVPLVTGDA